MKRSKNRRANTSQKIHKNKRHFNYSKSPKKDSLLTTGNSLLKFFVELLKLILLIKSLYQEPSLVNTKGHLRDIPQKVEAASPTPRS